ncbi:MAG: hypothetical protein WCI73_16090, partial [Phycisphaerae bacterium]
MNTRPKVWQWILSALVAPVILNNATAQAGITDAGDILPTSDPATWTSRPYVYVGNKSDGTLTINGGSVVQANWVNLGQYSGATGTATIDGTGSALDNWGMYIGYFGTGIMNITNGAWVGNNYCFLAQMTGSRAIVTVDGVGSLWRSQQTFTVGHAGVALVNITHGAAVNSDSGYIGGDSGSMGTVTVDGVGSTWETSTSSVIHVGDSGNGTLNITNGATVSSGIYGCFLGYSSGSVGATTVDGAGSSWASGGLIVGSAGAGTLNIINGGKVNSGNVAGNYTNSALGYMNGILNECLIDSNKEIWAPKAVIDLNNVLYYDTGAFGYGRWSYKFNATVHNDIVVTLYRVLKKINTLANEVKSDQ